MVALCTVIDCTSNTDEVTVCNPQCAPHGGLSFVACISNQATKCPQGDGGPVVPPYGPNYQECGCKDGLEVDFCTTNSCGSGIDMDDLCSPFCMAHGGLQFTGCLENLASKCPPP